MREIKFRVWDKVSKKIYYDCGMEIRGNSILNIMHIPMQFTGIKDKNGKSIYEGDILKIKPNPEDTFFVEVIFYKGSFCYKTKENAKFSFYSEIRWAGITKNRKIVGNIYENPKLMKK